MAVDPHIQWHILKKLKDHFSFVGHPIAFTSTRGGCINETYCIDLGQRNVFCKLNNASKFPGLLAKEKRGLEFIAVQNIFKTPAIIDWFEVNNYQVLLLEWIDEGERDEGFWKTFGEQLAALHQVSNEYFGLSEDNYMGSVPQSNSPSDNWIDFFMLNRLEPLVKKCVLQKQLSPKHQSQFEVLYAKLKLVFNDAQRPSLVHGDLWSGNFICNQRSEPVLIDTAIYFGHPSMDLAMTTLFGGFHPDFYESYQYYSPLPLNYKDQWDVCNLYPLLIHLHLFGSSYLRQIERILNRFT